MTAGLGSPDGLDYITAARANDGSTVIVYLPSARRITVEMSKIAGAKAAAWWYYPSSGRSIFGGSFATTRTRTFTPPRPGDWVLVLDDTSYRSTPPGQSARRNGRHKFVGGGPDDNDAQHRHQM